MTSSATSQRNAGRRRRGFFGDGSRDGALMRRVFPDDVSLGKGNAKPVVIIGDIKMAKPGRVVKKANHGKRPANAKARRAKRRIVKT